MTDDPGASGHWRGMALVVAGCVFMLNLDSSIITTSLPQIAASFHRQPVALSIAISAYILAGAAVVPLSGWLADRIGTRTVMLAALATFVVASVACGLAASFWPFLLARIVQGAGGAVMMPVGQAIVLRAAGRHRMIEAIGLAVWPSLIAPVLGPALGGFITTFITWRWNFWLNLPLGIAFAVLVAIMLPNERAGEQRPLDLAGLGLTSLSMVSLLAGLDLFSGGTARLTAAAGLIAAGLGLGALAVRHLRRHRTPLLDLAPLRRPSFALTTAGPGLCFRAIFAATPFLLPLMLQLGYHLSAAAAGALVLVYFAGNLGMKTCTTAILRRVPFRPLLVANGLVAAATVATCGWVNPHSPRPLLMALLLAAGASRSLQFTALTTLGFADIAPAEKNNAATLSSLIIQGGMAAGIALAAFLLNLVQARHAPLQATVADFRLVFAILAGLCATASLGCLRLHAHVGDRLRENTATAAETG